MRQSAHHRATWSSRDAHGHRVYCAKSVATLALRLLGPVQLFAGDGEITPSARKERALLALLALRADQVVPADLLIEELWPDLPPENGRRTLQVRIAALRRVLHEAGCDNAVQFLAPGYRLSTVGIDVDWRRFLTLVDEGARQASSDELGDAAVTLRAALALWRGRALDDVKLSRHLERESDRLEQARLAATQDLFDAELSRGHHDAVLAGVDELLGDHPLDERLWAHKILALYRAGRQSEALRACRSLRRSLADEVGVAPGPALRDLEADILAQRSDLDWKPPPSPSTEATVAVSTPPVHYAKTPDGTYLAYQVVGDGPPDLIVVPGFVSHLDTWWEAYAGRLVRRLSSFARVILYDKRGTGLSDRPAGIDAQQWVDDIDVILDAAGSEQAVVIGMSGGGGIAALYAATRPQRVRALVLYATWARLEWAADFPLGVPEDQIIAGVDATAATWGRSDQIDPVSGMDMGLGWYCPSADANSAAQQQWRRFQPRAASPSAARQYAQIVSLLDVRDALPQIVAPTLVLHPSGDRCVPLQHAYFLAAHIPGASLVELDSDDHLIWFSDAIDALIIAIQTFVAPLTRRPQSPNITRPP